MIATKFGFDIDLNTGERRNEVNSRPEHVKMVAEASLKHLGVDVIDLSYKYLVFKSDNRVNLLDWLIVNKYTREVYSVGF